MEFVIGRSKWLTVNYDESVIYQLFSSSSNHSVSASVADGAFFFLQFFIWFYLECQWTCGIWQITFFLSAVCTSSKRRTREKSFIFPLRKTSFPRSLNLFSHSTFLNESPIRECGTASQERFSSAASTTSPRMVYLLLTVAWRKIKMASCVVFFLLIPFRQTPSLRENFTFFPV